jgi:hypothetical protein
VRGGEFAAGLESCRAAALELSGHLSADRRFVAASEPELDIVVWAASGRRVSECSERARAIFEEAARRGLHLALAELPTEFFALDAAGVARDAERITPALGPDEAGAPRA